MTATDTDRIKAELRDEIKAELRDELRDEIKAELRDELRDEIKAELRDELRDEIKAELRDELRDEIKAELRDEIEADHQDLQERVDDLEDQPTIEIADDSDPIQSLRVEGAPLGKALTSKAPRSEVETEIEQLRADLADANPTPDADKPGSSALSQAETPLEQVVALPEHLVDDELTANQQRARFVASDVRDYATSVPAGWAITSSDLRSVLQAAFDAGHTQTVDRVMTILDDLGDDAARIVERRGTKRVILDDALVSRLDRLDDHHDVVMAGEA